MYKIDWNKPVRNRFYPEITYRVLCTDAPSVTPVVLLEPNGDIMCVDLHGRYKGVRVYHAGEKLPLFDRGEQLIENIPPEPHTVYVSIRLVLNNKKPHKGVRVYHAGEKLPLDHTVVAEKTITITEGEGV